MYVLIFLLEPLGDDEQTDKKISKIGIEIIDAFNFLALSSKFGRIPKYIDDRTVATHLVMTILRNQSLQN